MSLGYNHRTNDTQVGTRKLLACRALPGVSSGKNLGRRRKGVEKIDGRVKYDSFCSGDVFVIRRSCQILPCFLIHY